MVLNLYLGLTHAKLDENVEAQRYLLRTVSRIEMEGLRNKVFYGYFYRQAKRALKEVEPLARREQS